MKIQETVSKPTEGYFKLECFDKDGNTIDVYEHKNMIMERSKASVANSTMGHVVPIDYINKFVMGDRGHDVTNGNLLVGRDFSFARTGLFAEEDTTGSTYAVVFNPLARAAEGVSPVIYEGDSTEGQTIAGIAEVKVNIINVSTVEYVIDINASSANGTGVKPWTEAALYTKREESPTYDAGTANGKPANGKIFAMRTFPAKIKEDTTTFRITWQVVF